VFIAYRDKESWCLVRFLRRLRALDIQEVEVYVSM
jgi:hypothetical protein